MKPTFDAFKAAIEKAFPDAKVTWTTKAMRRRRRPAVHRVYVKLENASVADNQAIVRICIEMNVKPVSSGGLITRAHKVVGNTNLPIYSWQYIGINKKDFSEGPSDDC